MLTMGVHIEGLDAVRREMARLSGPQLREAYAKGLTDTGFQVRREMQREMDRVFDRVTPWVRNSVKVFPATPADLEVTVAPTYWSAVGTTGGKAGVDPQQVLQAQEQGGARRDKRSESALRRVGILPQGFQIAIPGDPLPGSHDGRGNLRGPFVAQLISYFQAFGEQGYRANMGKRRMDALHRGGQALARKMGGGPMQGRRYIVAYGKLRAGARLTRAGEPDQRASNLPPGIWAVVGTTGADVRPVAMFIRRGSYTPRLDLQAIAASASTQDHLARRLRFRIREAAGV